VGPIESPGDVPGGPVPIIPGIYPLDGFALDLPYADLAPLAAIVGEATYVGLGESIHTADAFLAGKARITRWLVEEQGFRVIGLETPWYEMRALEDHLRIDDLEPWWLHLPCTVGIDRGRRIASRSTASLRS
jgi:hypothetical protein